MTTNTMYEKEIYTTYEFLDLMKKISEFEKVKGSDDISGSDLTYMSSAINAKAKLIIEQATHSDIRLDYVYNDEKLRKYINDDKSSRYVSDNLLPINNFVTKIANNTNKPSFVSNGESLLGILLKYVYDFDYAIDLATAISKNNGQSITSISNKAIQYLLKPINVAGGYNEERDRLVLLLLGSRKISQEVKDRILSTIITENDMYNTNDLLVKIFVGSYIANTPMADYDFTRHVYEALKTNKSGIANGMIMNLSYNPNEMFEDRDINNIYSNISLVELALKDKQLGHFNAEEIIKKDEFKEMMAIDDNNFLYNRIYKCALINEHYDFATDFLKSQKHKFDDQTIAIAHDHFDHKLATPNVNYIGMANLNNQMCEVFVELTDIKPKEEQLHLYEMIESFADQCDPIRKSILDAKLEIDANEEIRAKRNEETYYMKRLTLVLRGVLNQYHAPIVNDLKNK
mgnify:CR=1 FL=1